MLDWSILRTNEPVDVAGNFARGYQVASSLIDKYHERNALAALANQPNDPAALATLYQINPQLGEYFHKRGLENEQIQRRVLLSKQYTGGDTRGAETAAVSAGDFDLAEQFQKLDKAQQDRAADFWTKAGPIAYKLKQTTDPAARQALWAQAKPILQSEGIDQAQLDKFDPTNDAQLDAAIVTAQKIGELVSQDKPDIHSVEQGGGLYSIQPDGTFKVLVQPNPGDQQLGAPVHATVPAPAVSYLKAHPELAPQFDEKYGRGASQSVLGGQSGGSSAGGFSMRNNPGALRVPGSMRFHSFSSPQEGIQAQEALLGRYMGRGLRSVSSIVETYAPRESRGGDNTDAQVNNYIGYVARRLNVNPMDTLSDAMLPRLAQAMREFETGRRAD